MVLSFLSFSAFFILVCFFLTLYLFVLVFRGFYFGLILVNFEFLFLFCRPLPPFILQITRYTVTQAARSLAAGRRTATTVFVGMSCHFVLSVLFRYSYFLQRIMAASRRQDTNPVVQALLGAIAQQDRPPRVEVPTPSYLPS